MKNRLGRMSDARRAEIAELAEQIYQVGYSDGQAAVSSVEDTVTVKLTSVDELKVGDKVKFLGHQSDFNTDVTNGKVYVVDEIDEDNDALFFGDSGLNGCRSYFSSDTIHLFEKVVESETSEPLTANQQRAEVIQRAREFVEGHQRDLAGFEERTYGNDCCKHQYYETEFFTKNNRVTAVIHLLNQDRERLSLKRIVGRSKCMPGDVFNEWIGKAIALARALKIDIPQEFMEAVQPTELVVGMDVFYGGRNQTVDLHEKWLPVGVSKEFAMTALSCNIIDDTNAEYANES